MNRLHAILCRKLSHWHTWAAMALAGVRVLELAGLAPVPFCGMILADFGAKVIRVDKANTTFSSDAMARGKRSIALNLKTPQGIGVLKTLCKQSDVLIEPFRHGKLLRRYTQGVIHGDSSAVQEGRAENSQNVGKESYTEIAGLLSRLGKKHENPTFPMNMLADFAGGSYTCALGIVMSLFERTRSGRGQVIDSSMVEGAAYLGSFVWKSQKLGLWSRPRGENMLDGGAPFYNTYVTTDGKYMAVGAIEPQFYKELLKGLDLDPSDLPDQMSFSDWPEMKKQFAVKFLEKTQDQWCQIFDGTDACVTPVLSFDNVAIHQHNKERGSFFSNDDGDVSPRPAPLLSRTPAEPSSSRDPFIGEHTHEVLAEHGFSAKQISDLKSSKVISCHNPKSQL
ncbi:unnamed protein product [Ranitomeya imitator]|uniref:Alpha-methylacyl-CoA racemase n=1 Tax=Ranitomeya imitator TaxID=111125 RepID=A0ABN9LUL1_9NEOB|nr:unnamed protein product [Ranitomeya imitator]